MTSLSESTLPTIDQPLRHPNYRPDIDGLRAIAILSVVAFHAFPSIIHGGFVGVDVFFVISGFLISSIIFGGLQRGDFSFAEFYARRVKRIFPALITVLGACYIFGWFALLPEEFKQLGKHIAAGSGFVQNFALWKESGYFDTASTLKPLIHLWSLAIEEQFYLLYPVVIWGAWRFGLNIFTAVLLLGLLSFSLNISGIETNSVRTFFLPQTRFWELLVGAALAYLTLFKRQQLYGLIKFCVFSPVIFQHPPLPDRREAIINNLISTFGLILVAISLITIHEGDSFPGWRALAPTSGTLLLIMAGPNAWINRKILANRFMVSIGLISYPLYLWHWPILSFARIMESEIPSREIRIAAVALSFLLAWLTYRLIERPIRFGRNSWIKTAALTVVLALIGYLGYNAFERGGLPFRSDIRQSQKNNEQFNWGANSASAECRKSYPELAGEHCILSKPGNPTILLLGDSHSNQLFPGLADLSAGTNEIVANFASGGCLPFYDTASFQKGSTDTCATYTDKVLSYAENTTTVHTIVMSSRGPLYTTGKGFDGEPQPHDRKLVKIGQPEIVDYGKIFEAGMRETLSRLMQKGKDVVFVMDNPELGFDPKSCLDSRPLTLSNSTRKLCAVPKIEYNKRNFEYRKIVKEVLRDFPKVKLFDASELLCDDNFCWGILNGEMLYRDDDHLSLLGSKFLARRLWPMLTHTGK